jgi:hypothetical protein
MLHLPHRTRNKRDYYIYQELLSWISTAEQKLVENYYLCFILILIEAMIDTIHIPCRNRKKEYKLYTQFIIFALINETNTAIAIIIK